MLAQRFAGVLPDMTVDEALESAAVASLAGSFRPEDWGRRPTRQPHHTASAVALASPSPRLPPVTMTFLPLSPRSMSCPVVES